MGTYFEMNSNPTPVMRLMWIYSLWSHSTFKTTQWVTLWHPALSRLYLLHLHKCARSQLKANMTIGNGWKMQVDDGRNLSDYSYKRCDELDFQNYAELSQQRCMQGDEYSSRRLINDERRQCSKPHNTLLSCGFCTLSLHLFTVYLQLDSPIMLFLELNNVNNNNDKKF